MQDIPKTILFCGKDCGTNSKEIYEKYAQMFDWDTFQRTQFGAQRQPLYARDATPEGYSVWCIAYSNLNGRKGGHWRNRFTGGYDVTEGYDLIEEFWEIRTHDHLHDFSEMTTRVVFAKNQKGHYQFFGVYECVSRTERQQWVDWANDFGYLKTYRRVSKGYPRKMN